MLMLLLAAAVSSPAYNRCVAAVDHGGFVKSQLLECVTNEMDRADAALNAQYKAVMSRLPAARRMQLRASERRWIDQRRATCSLSRQAAIPSSEINRVRCLVRETDARTAWIARYR